MKAMILAAGLGKRMRPLTNHTPKPLLQVNGRYLIEYHLERLAKAGISEVVINTHWLGEQLPQALGQGDKWGLSILYSHEAELLETAGGIIQALPHLVESNNLVPSEPFLVINGDVFTDIDLAAWLQQVPELNQSRQAFLALVPNPEHNPNGDFGLNEQTGTLSLLDEQGTGLTYSGIALFHPLFFSGLPQGHRALGPLLKYIIKAALVHGALCKDYWLDVGTPERLQELEGYLGAFTRPTARIVNWSFI